MKPEEYIYNEIDKEKLGINIFKGLSNANNDLIEMDL
tara:strand:- start:113 stop:223 length:111 start_codon:yes stop_codon:yes gene_type:complete